ncbi:hypothetical protein DFH07DRAFT_1061790 [Mycena maculata]|uniref:Uncharacterized protein n=1 Tax=Mycena maculata TaxID=230809 RepID=A0AAD7IWA0_9AGAR|nr:hypothetical protein DFH07DRAFT_1061790 [Mycena maculata]
MRDFPQELIDEILDQAAAQKSGFPGFSPGWSLKGKGVGTRGLVCRQWWPRSRMHLFSHVTLRPTTIQSFFDLVDTSQSPILTFIASLDLRFAPDPRFLDEGQRTRFRECCQLTNLWIYLPNLELPGTDTTEFYSSVQLHASSLGIVPSISWFSMNFESIPLSVAVGVVSAFPALHTLRVSGLELVRVVIPQPHPLSVRIHTLEFGVRGEGVDGFFSYLLSLPDPPLLRNVDLDVGRADPDGAVVHYLRKSGSIIQHLTLEEIPLETSCARLAIQYAINLQDLYLIGEVVPLLDFVAAVSSHKLATFRIYQILWAEDVTPNPWSEIEAVLTADSRFRGL